MRGVRSCVRASCMFLILALVGSILNSSMALNISVITNNATNAGEEGTITNVTNSLNKTMLRENASAHNVSIKGDKDEDGIDDYEEWAGHVSELDGKIYFTDNTSESTDRDPYDDGQEVDGHSPAGLGDFGGQMPASVKAPGRHPLVPSYPDLKVELVGIEVVAKCKITSTETKEEGESWLLTTETHDWVKTAWGVESSFSLFPFSIGVKPYYKSEHESYTYTLSSTSGWSREEWSKATAVDSDKAAKLKFHLKIKNDGTDAAKDVKLVFNVKIGEKVIDTVWTGETPIAGLIGPGGTYPAHDYIVIDTDKDGNEIVVSLDDLKSIELGAPVSIEIVEIIASVPWGKEYKDWSTYISDIDGVSARIMIDFGDGEVRDYRVFSGIRYTASPPYPYIMNISLKEAINWLVGLEEREDGIYIGTAPHVNKPVKLENWTFGFDNETYRKINETLGGNWTIYDLLNVSIRQGWVIVMKAPDTKPPEIHWASYSRDMKTIKAAVYDNENITHVFAHVKIGDKYEDVELKDENHDLIYEATLPEKITDTDDDYIIASDGKFNTTWTNIPRITKVWRVDDDRKECEDADFTGIQEAINNESVADGDTILVYPGIYCESVVVNKSVILKGIGNPIVCSWSNEVINVTADNCTIEGFNINITTFSDDFNTYPWRWKFEGSAYWDENNGYVVLTPNRDWEVGVIWFDTNITSDMTVKFKYKAGGGTGADGMVFMFYKKKDYTPKDAGGLGFIDSKGNAVHGYGIEFDNYRNSEYNDPSWNHTALIKDHVKNHLIWKDDKRTEDYKWHNVSVEINGDTIRVSVDNESIFNWTGVIDRTYGGLGFGAATGGANNWHIIDDVKILCKEQTTTYRRPGSVVKDSAGDSYSDSYEIRMRTDSEPLQVTPYTYRHSVAEIEDEAIPADINESETGRPHGRLSGTASTTGIQVPSSNNIIANNTIIGQGYGIELCYANDNLIVNNVVTHNHYNGISLYQSLNNTIQDNEVSNNGYDGIYLFCSSNNIILKNNILNNSGDGIYIYFSSNNSIVENIVSENRYGGIRLYIDSDNNISANKVSNNSYGILSYYSPNNSLV